MSEATPDPTDGQAADEYSVDVDRLLTQIRDRVQQRRSSGDYPPGLEDDMENHFRRIVSHRASLPSSSLQADVDAIDSHMAFGRSRITTESAVTGGALVHRVVNKAVARQSEAILQQVQEFAEAVRRAIQSLAASVQDPASHVHGDLIGHLEAVIERLESYERSPADNVAALGDLRRRVEALEANQKRSEFKPWFKYEDFEARVGRSKEALEALYAPDAEALIGYGPVLDIGCGRGEFLGLLRDRGVECRGIELDPVQADEARQRGFDVATGDGIAMLETENDASLGAVVLYQVVEHIDHGQLLDLVRAAYDKLRPGGKLIIETPNPQSIYILAHSFWLDPTHDHLLHPLYLEFLMNQAGFSEVGIDWRNMPNDEVRLHPVPGAADSAENANVQRLNTLLFAAQDYAITAVR